MKKLTTLSFEERDELNQFVNKNKIPREDVVNIEKHWNFGDYNFILSFYADDSLNHAIQEQNKKNDKDWKDTKRVIFIILVILIGIIGVSLYLNGSRPWFV